MSAPRSMLLQGDNMARSGARIRLSRLIAEALYAQVNGLDCLHHGLNAYALSWTASASIVSVLKVQDRANLEHAYASFVREGGGYERLQWAEPRVDRQAGSMGTVWSAELVMLGQRDRSDQSTKGVPSDFVSEGLLCSRPEVMELPHVGVANPLGHTVLTARKPIRETAQVVSTALLWLKRAKHVHVICCAVDDPAVLVQLERWLSTEGIEVVVHDGDQESDDVGKLLLARVVHLEAHRLVMGAYGHGRAREWVLDGAKPSVLQSMIPPVLMAH